MNKPRTTLDHARRIERAVAHIGDHLDAPLDLMALAEVACLSPHHFHRVYRALVGETPADTLRRGRLHRAATALARGGAATLAEVARMAGYGSQAAFTRAFTDTFGVSPGQYRGQGGLSVASVGAINAEDRMREVTIITQPDLPMAAMAHQGDYHLIGTAFDRLVVWAGGRGLLTASSRWIGVYLDDPAAVAVDRRRSHACLVLADGQTAAFDDTVRPMTLVGGRFAQLIHKGPYAELEGAYRELYGQWLPTSGEEAADQPCHEEYLNDCRALPPSEWLTAVRLPLVG